MARRGILLAAAAAVWAASGPETAPEQPIPYSHRQHVALGLKCSDCHTMPDPGELMTFPATAKCMTCHASMKTGSPAIEKLASFHREKRPVPWARVYQIPSYVFFSHQAHLEAGGTCEGCHGPVGERDKLWKERDISMGACMDCHRARKASLDCNYCHESRQ